MAVVALQHAVYLLSKGISFLAACRGVHRRLSKEMMMAFMNEDERGECAVDLKPLLTEILKLPDMSPAAEQYLRWVAAKVASEAFWEDVKDHMRTTVDEEFQDQDSFGDDEVDDPPEEVIEEGQRFGAEGYDLAYEAIYQRLKGWVPWTPNEALTNTTDGQITSPLQ